MPSSAVDSSFVRLCPKHKTRTPKWASYFLKVVMKTKWYKGISSTSCNIIISLFNKNYLLTRSNKFQWLCFKTHVTMHAHPSLDFKTQTWQLLPPAPTRLKSHMIIMHYYFSEIFKLFSDVNECQNKYHKRIAYFCGIAHLLSFGFSLASTWEDN